LRAQASAPDAEAPHAWRFVDLWLTHDQHGRRAFERGDFAGAAALFDDPVWRGVAQYRAGQYAQAVQSFALIVGTETEFRFLAACVKDFTATMSSVPTPRGKYPPGVSSIAPMCRAHSGPYAAVCHARKARQDNQDVITRRKHHAS